jgi:hypothetical protein
MAIGIHVVYVQPKTIDQLGNVVDKTAASTTIGTMLRTSLDHRVVPNADIPNSAGWPTIKEYLEAEAADDYIANHISNTMIVTYDAGDANAAT